MEINYGFCVRTCELSDGLYSLRPVLLALVFVSLDFNCVDTFGSALGGLGEDNLVMIF
jgi:hypothetical protein